MPEPVTVAFCAASKVSLLTLAVAAEAFDNRAWISSEVYSVFCLREIVTLPSAPTTAPSLLLEATALSTKLSSERLPAESNTESAVMLTSTLALSVAAVPLIEVVPLADMEPSSSLMPLKLAESAMRLISLLSWLTSFWSCLRSVPSSKVPLADCSASSYMRLSMSWTSVRAPSAVCTREMPSLALSWALSRPVIWARIFSEMARPAASSPARLIL